MDPRAVHAGADAGVGDVDGGVCGRVEGVDGGADGDVLPAPTSPVTSAMACSSMVTADPGDGFAVAGWSNSSEAASCLENGVRDSPQ